jgi:hypothetical protein
MAEENPTTPATENQGRWGASSRRKRERRIAAGLCASCGHARDGDGLICAACREKMRVRLQRHTEKRRAARPPKPPTTLATRPEATECKRRRRAEWRAAGLCIKCGGPRADDGMACCPGCRAKDRDSRERVARGEKTPRVVAAGASPMSMAEYKRAWKAKQKEAGVCTNCRGPRDVDGALLCAACHAKHRADYQRIGKARYEKRAPAVNAETRAKREAWKAAGKCNWCGGDKENPKRLRCTACNARAKEVLRAQRRRRTAAGLCPKCGGARDSGNLECSACLLKRKAEYEHLMATNPDSVRLKCWRRRTRLIDNGGTLTVAEWKAIKELYDYRCLKCGRREPEIKLTLDHVLPVVMGGKTEAQNSQCLCSTCNKSKGGRHIDYRPHP